MTLIRVLIADDNVEVREAIAELIAGLPDLILVAAAADADEAVAMAREHHPDVALLDISMPGGGGARAAREIRMASPRTAIVAHSAERDPQAVAEMFASGAVGFAQKGSRELPGTIRRAARGQPFLSDELAGVLNHPDPAGRQAETVLGTRQAVVERVRTAIEGDALRMFFQPIVELRTGMVSGLEALARFPEGAPSAWFEAAEAVGLRVDLELAAVRAALAAADSLPPRCYLGMNLSPETVMDPRLMPLLSAAEKRRIVIDLTRLDAIESYPEIQEKLGAFRFEDTHQVAVDDAGTGSSSLEHILRITPDFVKLDVSVTHELDRNSAHREVASAIVSLSSDLGAHVIGEGVETQEEADALLELGVSQAQGFLFGRPGPLPV